MLVLHRHVRKWVHGLCHSMSGMGCLAPSGFVLYVKLHIQMNGTLFWSALRRVLVERYINS